MTNEKEVNLKIENLSIPEVGIDRNQILKDMQSFKKEDINWKEGRTWSLVYHINDQHSEFLKEAHNLYFSENFLNPMAFKSLKKMEGEVVRMTAKMLSGDDQVCGTMTSGGTESILMAVKTYRQRARKLKPWILRPEMVVPESVHAAFAKAAHYFDVKIIIAPMKKDYTVDVKALKKLITRNTILIVGSAMQYPHGVIDPIDQLSELALRKKIPLHVDACIGGFILPWIEKLGYQVTPWDFRNPGVTSISADVHKFGYAAKGASTITYRSMKYLKYQFFVHTDWNGGIYASPNMPGTRPGGPIAAAWAALKSIGAQGYIEYTKQIMKNVERFKKGITEINELQILGEPVANLIAFNSLEKAIDIYAVGDQLEKKGWQVTRQQFPASIHINITFNHTSYIDQYLADLKEAVDTIRKNPQLVQEGNAPMYGMMAKIPVRSMVKMSVQKIMEGMWGPTGEVPDLSQIEDDDSLLFKFVNKYGDKAMDIIEQVEQKKNKFKENLQTLLNR